MVGGMDKERERGGGEGSIERSLNQWESFISETRIADVAKRLSSVLGLTLGKPQICRVPDKGHSANLFFPLSFFSFFSITCFSKFGSMYFEKLISLPSAKKTLGKLMTILQTIFKAFLIFSRL